MKTITVTIDKQGKPTIEANGFLNGSCKAATKPLEDALSGKDEKIVTDKPEMFIAQSGGVADSMHL